MLRARYSRARPWYFTPQSLCRSPWLCSICDNDEAADAAKKLIDYLLSAEVDRALVDEKFAWCSTRDAAGKGRFMDVDYHAVATRMPGAIRRATSLLEGRD